MNNESMDKQKEAELEKILATGPSLPSDDDITFIMDNILEVMKDLESKEVRKIRKKNKEEFLVMMENKHPQFSSRYYSIFRKLACGEDISFLFEMFEMVRRIRGGELTFQKGEELLGQRLGQMYIRKKD